MENFNNNNSHNNLYLLQLQSNHCNYRYSHAGQHWYNRTQSKYPSIQQNIAQGLAQVQ